PRRGAIVNPISISDIEEIYHLRALLEAEVIEQSVPNLTEQEIDELEKLYNQMTELIEDSGNLESYMEVNAEFHRLMRKGCNWRRTQNIIENLWSGLPQYTPSLLSKRIKESQV